MAINQGNTVWTPAGTPQLDSFMNAKTFVVLAILFVIEFVAFLYVNSFFSAGYFGMLKNIVQDGSTSFDEFMPNAKRYWYPTFRYLALPYLILLVFTLPFAYFYGIFSMVAAVGGIMTASSLNYILITFAIAFIAAVAILFWFSYGPALIVFEDMDARQAMKTSFKLARTNLWPTTVMTVTCTVIVGVTMLLVYGVNLGFAWLVVSSSQLAAVANVVELLLNIAIISAGIVASVFIFYTYDELTMRKDARHMHTRKPTHHLKRKA
jgi:hypothetical protein